VKSQSWTTRNGERAAECLRSSFSRAGQSSGGTRLRRACLPPLAALAFAGCGTDALDARTPAGHDAEPASERVDSVAPEAPLASGVLVAESVGSLGSLTESIALVANAEGGVEAYFGNHKLRLSRLNWSPGTAPFTDLVDGRQARAATVVAVASSTPSDRLNILYARPDHAQSFFRAQQQGNGWERKAVESEPGLDGLSATRGSDGAIFAAFVEHTDNSYRDPMAIQVVRLDGTTQTSSAAWTQESFKAPLFPDATAIAALDDTIHVVFLAPVDDDMRAEGVPGRHHVPPQLMMHAQAEWLGGQFSAWRVREIAGPNLYTTPTLAAGRNGQLHLAYSTTNTRQTTVARFAAGSWSEELLPQGLDQHATAVFPGSLAVSDNGSLALGLQRGKGQSGFDILLRLNDSSNSGWRTAARVQSEDAALGSPLAVTWSGASLFAAALTGSNRPLGLWRFEDLGKMPGN